MAYYDFKLSQLQLLEVAEAFEISLISGLNYSNQQLKCLPTYTPISSQLYCGEVCVLDLGGSNLRASKIRLDNSQTTRIEKISEKIMPWKRGIPFDKAEYLSIQANLMKPYLNNTNLLGYCFSYPTNSLENRDAKLVSWTKGVFVYNTLNQSVGETLTDYVRSHFAKSITKVAVINDTVASLLAGLTLTPCDAYFSVIVGTGFNSAGLYPSENISKLTSDNQKKYHAIKLPVNLESGNFIPPHLSKFDVSVDENSENPGFQRFEKAVSGMYLGRVFKAAFPEIEFDMDSGAKGLVAWIEKSTAECPYRKSAISLLLRSAQLVAAQLFGLIKHYKNHVDKKATHFRFVCEGGLFWSNSVMGTYADLVESELVKLQLGSEYDNLKVDICKIEQANLIGSAIAVLTK